MSTAEQIRAAVGVNAEPEVPTPETAASSQAILLAGIKLYEAAGLIRQSAGVYASDIRDYLAPALRELQRQVERATERAKLPALEKRAPSIIQQGPDPAADLLRDVAQGKADIRF